MVKPFSEDQRQRWKEIIHKQKDSGLSIERYCRENNLAAHNFFYWKGKLFPKSHTLTRSTFMELVEEKTTGIIIEYKNIRIHLGQHFNPSTLKKCIEVLKEIKC